MTTTTERSRYPRSLRSGFTLLEVMISITLGTLVLGMATGGLLFMSRSLTSLTQYTDMSRDSRVALELFGRDVRMATNVFTANSHTLSVLRADADGGAVIVDYFYDPDNKTFSQQTGNEPPRIILRDIDDLLINYFTLRGDPTVNPLEVKEVQLEALMRRTALTAGATNYIISAQFIMRNRFVSN